MELCEELIQEYQTNLLSYYDMPESRQGQSPANAIDPSSSQTAA